MRRPVDVAPRTNHHVHAVMTSVPTLAWDISLPLEDLPIGPALTPEQREIEERVGVTRDVLWAYAEAMPELLGNAMMEDVQPLGFGRGSLVAIATETPVFLPDMRFVQTASVAVCREMGRYVPEFHIKGRECLDALLEHGSAVRRVWVRDCPAFEHQAAFEIVFAPIQMRTPHWRLRYGHDHLLRLAVLSHGAWLCYDRDYRHPVIDVDHRAVAGRYGPRDVAPEKHPPPWAHASAYALGGNGWASTILRRDGSQMADEVMATPDRRWLLLHSFPDYPGHNVVVRAWREKCSIRPYLKGMNTWSVGADLELQGDRATFHWVADRRVLRIRHNHAEQLTTDHDLKWQMAQEHPEGLSPDLEELATRYPNVTATSLGSHDFAEGTCDVQTGDRFVLLSSTAHEILREVVGENIGSRLSAGTVHDVARWILRVLRSEEGECRHPVLLVDADATVTIAPWYDEPVRMSCEVGEDASWRLLAGASRKPWSWPIAWRLGIREQMARGELIPHQTVQEGDVLSFRNHQCMAFEWKDGDWRDVWMEESHWTLRASGALKVSDPMAMAIAQQMAIEAQIHEMQQPAIEIAVTSVRDLVEHPEQYHGRRIHTRGVFTVATEQLIFADAWFDCTTPFPSGRWLVEVEGVWHCHGASYGHKGQYKSKLIGDARLVSFDMPRPIAPERIQFARAYAPLVSDVVIERRWQGYTHNKWWLMRLGADARMPRPDVPDMCRARMVFAYNQYHQILLFSLSYLDEPRPLVPESATAAQPGSMGRWVEIKGTLTTNDHLWPLLEGVLPIVPPSRSVRALRNGPPDEREQAIMRQWIGDGKVVRVVGEVGRKASILYAHQVQGSAGMLELP